MPDVRRRLQHMQQHQDLDDLKALAQAANYDMQCCFALLDAQPGSQFARRTVIRTAFAFVEAWVTVSRQLLIDGALNGVASVPTPELLVLRGERHVLDDSGQVKVQAGRFEPGRRTVRFLLLTATQAYGLETAPDLSGPGWQAFAEAWVIRNRLTHPSRSADLQVSDDDLDTVRNGHMWFLSAVTTTSNSIAARMTSHLANGV